MAQRPVPSSSGIEPDQSVSQRLGGEVLQPRIERGAYPQSALVNAVGSVACGLAEPVDQLAADLFDEVTADRFELRRAPQHRAERRGDRLVMLRLADKAVAQHFAKHVVAPGERSIGVPDRIVVRRPLGQDREIGELRQRKVVELLVKIGVARGLDAERVAAQRDLIEIQLQDLRLRQRVLDPISEDRLLQLARRRIFVADQQVLGDLLRNRRAALGPPPRAELAGIIDHRAGEAGVIDPVMLEKGLVLGSQEGAHQQRRILGVAQFDAAFTRIGLNGYTIDPPHVGRQRRLVALERVDRRQAANDQHPQHQIGQRRQSHQSDERLYPPMPPGARAAPSQTPGRAGKT